MKTFRWLSAALMLAAPSGAALAQGDGGRGWHGRSVGTYIGAPVWWCAYPHSYYGRNYFAYPYPY